MKARVLTSVAAIGALAVVACNQDLAKSPLAPTQAQFSVSPSACSYPAMRTAAAAYLADPRAMNELITAMSRAVGQANVNAAGFNILTALAAAADAGAPTVKGTPADGSTFANAVLGCMVVTGYSAPVDFSGAFGAGIFEVRDGSGSAPVTSHLLDGGAPAF